MEGTWSLGMLADGESAGSIEWRLDDDDLERFGVYFPLTLLLRATVEGSNPAVTVVRDSNGGLLQVLTPSVFADIRELESLPPKLSIKFFSSAAAIGGSPFGVDQDAIPFAVWTIEQLPEGSNDADFRVTQYESAGAGGDGALGAILTSYVYSVLLNVQQGTSTWTLATYDGDIGPSETPLRVEVLSKENGGLAKHRKIYEGNALVTDVTETSSTYSWGAAVTSHTQYTGVGDPLVTSYQYYANPIRPGAELASVIRPDGSWRAYTYEIDSQSDDYIMIVYSGWLDEPLPTSLGSPAECENCLATVHRYRASDGREVSTTEYALGEVVGRTEYSYQTNSSGDVIGRSTSRCANWNGTNCVTALTEQVYYQDAMLREPSSVTHADERVDSYDYAMGIYSSYAFTVNPQGAYRRVTIEHLGPITPATKRWTVYPAA
ncbi:MAG: hypothetical protein IPM13_00415 [Phycisphaerales bacterium]|nr:hypothetical protein [Phycisphaerales bacterium]